MRSSSSRKDRCVLCSSRKAVFPEQDSKLCAQCHEQSERLFEEEMRRIELIRTVRGRDVELYDVKHPDSSSDKKHCGQVVLMKVGRGFEVKVLLRSDALDWTAKLVDGASGFQSRDNRLDALIGNAYLLMESWGPGPYYMDIFYVDKVVSTEGEV